MTRSSRKFSVFEFEEEEKVEKESARFVGKFRVRKRKRNSSNKKNNNTSPRAKYKSLRCCKFFFFFFSLSLSPFLLNFCFSFWVEICSVFWVLRDNLKKTWYLICEWFWILVRIAWESRVHAQCAFYFSFSYFIFSFQFYTFFEFWNFIFWNGFEFWLFLKAMKLRKNGNDYTGLNYV